MKKQFAIILIALLTTLSTVAESYFALEPLKLEVPEMTPTLVQATQVSLDYTTSTAYTAKIDYAANSASASALDFDFFKSKTNPNTKPFTFMEDMTFVGVPLFVAGWAVKGDKAMFRVNAKAEQGGKRNTQLLTDFKTGIDDYTQYFGPAMTLGLKMGGYEGRSDWPRLLTSAAFSYGLMAAFVNGIKYTAKEMRPDGTSANSWPSGHTATSFVGATILHKEYGLTRSPWFSVAGYGVATATGVMRVLNNRHWISDVMSGAGLGILSTELGYAFGDLLFKERGILRNNLEMDIENPSFFNISMGLGLGSKTLDFEDQLGEDIEFRAATVVDAEGAYFFNKYVGVGGRFRVRAMSAKSFGSFSENAYMEDWRAWEEMADVYRHTHPEDFPAASGGKTAEEQYNQNIINFFNRLGFLEADDTKFNANSPVTDISGVVKSDHITEFTGSLGLYFNLPLTSRLSLGTKALIGRSITQDMDIDGHAEGNVKDINYSLVIKNGKIDTDITDASGKKVTSVDYPVNTGEKFTDDWDYLTLSATNSTSWGTGLSLTYKYKSNFSWKLFIDYDYTKKTYTLRYDPYHFLTKGLTENAYNLMAVVSDVSNKFGAMEAKKDKKMNYFTIGASFAVNF